MKFSGHFEISGITRLVIDKDKVWIKEITRSGQIIWRLEHTHKRRPDSYIIGRIQHFISDMEYRVWFHNESCNVEKLAKVTKTIDVVYQPHKVGVPVLCGIMPIIQGGMNGTSRTKNNHR